MPSTQNKLSITPSVKSMNLERQHPQSIFAVSSINFLLQPRARECGAELSCTAVMCDEGSDEVQPVRVTATVMDWRLFRFVNSETGCGEQSCKRVSTHTVCYLFASKVWRQLYPTPQCLFPTRSGKESLTLNSLTWHREPRARSPYFENN